MALRLPGLARRPMHVDEAVHAEKFGSLLEENFYRYDRNEYHGPTLNYFTLIPAYLCGAKTLVEVDEFTLRIVPVFFGVLLILLLLLLYDGLGRGGIIFAGILTAISPAFVFYSRYYIQEMLLVCFTFGVIACGYRYLRTRKLRWIIFTGISLGLMHATKETSIIAAGSMLLALIITALLEHRQKQLPDIASSIKPLHCVAGLAAAIIVSVLFFSSFFTNPRGPADSVLTYANYFSRAGQNAWHIHPWYYYLKILIFSRYGDGPVWTEAFIVILAVVGFIVALRKKPAGLADFTLLRFLAFYTLIMTAVYSLIPYKTPWCLLGFFHGMILPAGVGAMAILKLSKNTVKRSVIIILLAIGCAHLGWQGYRASYKFSADPRNPYVYAHTTTDIFKIVDNVKDVARCVDAGNDIHIEVICPGYDYWPLPWYFREFENLALYSGVDYTAPAAPIIIVSPTAETDLIKKLYKLPPPGQRELYIPLFETDMQLRPGVPLRAYIKKSLWDKYAQQKRN